MTDTHKRAAGVLHDHANVGEVGVDETRRRNEIGDSLHAVQQHIVCHAKRRQHRCLVVGDVEQAIVRDDDQCVDFLAQGLDPDFGLHRAATAFEPERARHDRNRQRADAARHFGHDRGAAGTGAAALTRGDEHHVGALEDLLDLVAVVVCGLAPDLGIRTRA